MHFLLSALIENERHTELALAVNELVALDEPSDEGCRMLARRLCLAGLLSARLIREGVLESDKKIRQQFRATVSGLLSAVDAPNLVGWINPEHSRKWFAEVIDDSLVEFSESENIGAARASSVVMCDGDQDSSALVSLLAQKELDYRVLVIDSFCCSREDGWYGSRNISWDIKFLLSELLRSDWYLLGPATVEDVFRVLRNDRSFTIKCLEELGLSEKASAIFAKFIANESSTRGRRSQGALLHGTLEKHYGQAPNELDSTKWSTSLRAELESAGGLLTLLSLVEQSARKSGGRSWNLLEEYLVCHPGSLAAIPYSVKSNYFKDHGRAPSEKRKDRFGLRREFPGKKLYYTYTDIGSARPDWKGLTKDFPSVTLSAMMNDAPLDLDAAFQKLRKSGAIYRYLEDSLRTRRHSALQSMAYWGSAINSDVKLRAVLMRIAAQAVNDDLSNIGEHRFHAFKMNLDAEADALPTLAKLILVLNPQNFGGRHRAEENVMGIEDVINEYIPDPSQLVCLFAHEEKAVRTAAAVLAIPSLYSDKARLRNVLEIVRECYDEKVATWALPLAMRLLKVGVEERDNTTLEFMDTMLRLSRDHFQVRKTCEPILRKWREITRAPVSKSIEDIWREAS